MNRGFTWVELLVILVVVGLATLLAMPVFLHVREASLRARCLSHLRSISEAIDIYADSNDNVLPFSMPSENGHWETNREATGADLEFWSNAIDVEQDDLVCPVMDSASSYSYNGYLHAFSMDKVSNKGTAISVWEAYGKQARDLSLPRLDCGDVADPCNVNVFAIRTIADVPKDSVWTHGRGANFLYLDGHAEWRRLGGRAGRPTDPTEDPYHQYDKSGRVDKLWLDENGRAPLFKP